MAGDETPRRADYLHFIGIQTRWMDNDVYGHVNNVKYYSFFDTAINGFLIERGCLDIHEGKTIGLVVETMCRYKAPVAFPDRIEAGLRVAHIGTTSVRYEIGLFREASDILVAHGHFIHVYVDRGNRRPVPIDDKMRLVLTDLMTHA